MCENNTEMDNSAPELRLSPIPRKEICPQHTRTTTSHMRRGQRRFTNDSPHDFVLCECDLDYWVRNTNEDNSDSSIPRSHEIRTSRCFCPPKTLLRQRQIFDTIEKKLRHLRQKLLFMKRLRKIAEDTSTTGMTRPVQHSREYDQHTTTTSPQKS